MSMGHEGQLGRARALRIRGFALPPDQMPAPEILDSWARCIDTGLVAGQRAPVVVIEAPELARRREQAAVVRRLARAELETLSQQIAGSNFLLAFADRDSVILDVYQDNRFAMSNDAGILAGSCWSETLCGTNGLGTALATGRSVAVTGGEHYFLELDRISCTATPVRDAQGEIVGVLDASSYFESRQQHTQALVQMAAAHIENGLMLHQMRPHWVLAVHPRAEYLGTLSAGLMAFDDDGRLEAINQRGRQMLHGLRAVAGARFDEIFGEPFERSLPRLARGGEIRLRDLMGSVMVATCVNRPLRVAAPARPPVPAPGRRPEAPPRQGVRSAAGAPSGAMQDVAEPGLACASPDAAVREAYRLAARAAGMGAPILLQGETGCGKELLARYAHAASGRTGAFVAVNCGAMPNELFEAELFGYVGGAFTGARREGHAGLIVSADGGTLMLDEVRELALPLQAALLRFLDDRWVRPVGGTQGRHVDVQLVAATHGDLDADVAARLFRADLLYRLNTVRVQLPPLRDRSDLAQCVGELLHELQPRARLHDDALPVLVGYAWPGNFRELRAVLTRALVQGNGCDVTAEGVRSALQTTGAGPVSERRSVLQQLGHDRVRREFERCGGSISRTARVLGISRTTVYRHLRALGPPPA